ncbi:MAG: hypothetical protein Aurels2KO_57180 [Aureliella sp.]
MRPAIREIKGKGKKEYAGKTSRKNRNTAPVRKTVPKIQQMCGPGHQGRDPTVEQPTVKGTNSPWDHRTTRSQMHHLNRWTFRELPRWMGKC